MKSSMPFMGVRVPVMRKTARAVFDRYPPACAGEWQETILALWREATYREQRYAAVELAAVLVGGAGLAVVPHVLLEEPLAELLHGWGLAVHVPGGRRVAAALSLRDGRLRPGAGRRRVGANPSSRTGSQRPGVSLRNSRRRRWKAAACAAGRLFWISQ